jgi:hypothetical protein
MFNGGHPVRRAIASWSLLVLFLLGTATPAMSRMTCLKSGHSEVSVGYANDRCPLEAPRQGAAVRPVCCEVLTSKPEKHPFAVHAPVEVPLADFEAWGVPRIHVAELHRAVFAGCEQRAGPTLTRLAVIGALRL